VPEKSGAKADIRRLVLLILAGYTVLAIAFLQWFFTRNGQHPAWVFLVGAIPTVFFVAYGIRYLRVRERNGPGRS
jgi:hypothetical protein